MFVTLLGMVTLVRLVHPRKALLSMLVTLFGMVMLVRLRQPSKAPIPPMLVTLFGMVKEAAVFPAGYVIKIDLSLLYNMPSTEQYAVLLPPTFMAVRPPHPRKTAFPMLVTLFGMVILVSFVQR
jgi:drug/metabolite transporter (DMT)-like permease